VLVVASSGATLDLARRFAQRWEQTHPGLRAHVPPSVGTSGAVRAVADGVAQVGLAGRALLDHERGRPVVAHLVALCPVAFVSSGPREVTHVTPADLTRWFGDPDARWPDGRRVVPLLRERTDSGRMLLREAYPEVFAAMERAQRRRAPVLLTDQQMRDSLVSVDGGVGMLDVSIVRLERLPLTVLRIDGVEPTADNVLRGRYRLVRRVHVVVHRDGAPVAQSFVDTVLSAEVDDVLERAGCVRPLPPR